MNEKPFFDVFRTLKVDESLRTLFGQTVVTRVSMTPNQDVFRVYLTSKKLIAKNQLFQLEEQIRRQIFGCRKVRVHIFEKFLLSGQYTPEKLWAVYEDSVLMELERYSPYKRSIMKHARMNFQEEDTVRFGVSSRICDKEAVDDLARILDRVFNERCGFRVKVDVEYLDLDDPESRERNEAEFQQKITFLSENLRKERARKAEVPDGEQTENREEKDPVLKAAGIAGRKRPEAEEEPVFRSAGARKADEASHSGKATIRMCSTGGILKTNPLRWIRSSRRWARLPSGARSGTWRSGRSAESGRSSP